MNESHPNLLASLRKLPQPAWVLFSGIFLNKFGTFVIPFLTLYLTGRGFTLGEVGWAIGAYGVGNLAASVLGGYLSDRIGRRKTIVLSMFSVAAAMMVLCGAQNFWAILGLTALTGLTGELYRPASSALLADLVSTGQRVTAYSAYRVAFNMGWAFGPAAAGFLSGYGFFWLFAGDAGTSVLFGVVAYFALPRGVRATTKESGWREALCWMKKDRRLHRVLLSTLVMGLVTFQMSSTFGLQITHLGFSPKIYGLALSLNGILVVLCELPMTMVTRLFPARRVMALGYALEGVGFGLIAFAHSMAALAGCVVIFTVGEMLVMPVASAYMAQLAPANMRGRYMGVYGLMWSMALTVGPALGMRLFAVGQYALWLTCGGLGLLAGAIIAERRRGIQEF